ncbi:MAG: helix-turn-helix transcriptional regulator [Chloroflexi bacterium]|nr:helix-turn-helix transcriptional regulator [Chloroflexota bacterium]
MSSAKSEINVGELVRRLRQGRRLSVRTLAARTEFSPSFISQVELGQASPSIASLERIAAALGVTLAEFFEAEAADAAAGEADPPRRQITSQWSRAQIQALGGPGESRQLSPFLITIAPGGRSGNAPSIQPVEVFAAVIDGEVTLTLGNVVRALPRGDSVTIPAGTPHRWENLGTEEAKLVVVSVSTQRA